MRKYVITGRRVPEGERLKDLYYYDIRHNDLIEDTVEKTHVYVNHIGTIITSINVFKQDENVITMSDFMKRMEK